MGNTRFTGHALQYGGAPFAWDGPHPVKVSSDPFIGSDEGFALCSCGATSDVLTSGAARRQWYYQHIREAVK